MEGAAASRFAYDSFNPTSRFQLEAPPYTLSSRPERTRISYIAALTVATYAAFSKESRMRFANATNLNRKSGVAQWKDLQFPFPTYEAF